MSSKKIVVISVLVLIFVASLPAFIYLFVSPDAYTSQHSLRDAYRECLSFLVGNKGTEGRPSAVMAVWFKRLAGALTLIVALAIAWFAYCQHRLEKTRLKLEAYDRRLPVYNAIKKFISGASESPTDDKQLATFWRETRDAHFLFEDDDIPNYIEKVLYPKGREFILKEKKLNRGSLPQEELKKLGEETAALREWMHEQFSVVDSKFKKYLHLKE